MSDATRYIIGFITFVATLILVSLVFILQDEAKQDQAEQRCTAANGIYIRAYGDSVNTCFAKDAVIFR
jgi:hypothetical protein